MCSLASGRCSGPAVRLAHRSRSLATAAASSPCVDAERLALRLRLGEGWRASLGSAAEDVTLAHEALVSQGRLQVNDQQAAAVSALSRLPGALAEAREARQRWDDEQAGLTAAAERAAARVQDERKKAAAWEGSGWFKGSPSTPREPAIVGSVCWLSVGPPPALQPAGCYIYGTVGSGKSTVMDLFCLSALKGWRARRQHFHEFALWLHQELVHLRRASQGSEEPAKHILERVADRAAEGTDVLCLDEFAVTNVADAIMFAELLRLLAERQVAVVCTTNRPPEDLYKDGLHRERYVPAIVEHIRGNYLVAGISGSDYREEMLRAMQLQERTASEGTSTAANSSPSKSDRVFFQGLGVCMNATLGDALKGDGAEVPELVPGEVQVTWGRSLSVPGTSQGIARFHFDDLCRRALAAEDFLVLASSFHTIFVHDVPRLALEEHNEARRFTNLVDALYEHSVRLVCHSHVPIDEVLQSIESLQQASTDTNREEFSADRLGVFEPMYDDSPNINIQIKELGTREKLKELQDRRFAEEQLSEARRLGRLVAPEGWKGETGSKWSAAPAGADLSSPDQGVAGIMVAAVGSLQESGFAARRAASRLKEMQTAPYLEAARQRRQLMCAHSQ